MSQGAPPHPWADGSARRERPVGIVDIGSNSVRMVVYEGMRRTPLPMFNEKAVCALGQGLERTGRLNPEGVVMAFLAVGRFARLAREMGVEQLNILATAAVRDAEDGGAFVAELERRCGVNVRVLSGAQEAELAALGVLCSIPEARGLVADLGGGSLELVMVSEGTFGDFATMPLGVLRLSDASGGDRAVASDLVDRHILKLGWLGEARGKTLYAVGGAWRALARVCISQAAYPLQVLDNFTIAQADALQVASTIARPSRKSLEKVPGVSVKRLAYLPQAALVLERLLLAVRPERVVFSIYGMREGEVYKRRPPRIRREDPLISACLHMVQCAGRFAEHGEELMDWTSPLFADETPSQRRLRRAACVLGDVFWNEHPDYRAEQAFLRVLRLPFMGLDHRDRASLALAVYIRYKGDDAGDPARQARQLLDEEQFRRMNVLGLALRLGHTMSGGAPHLLRQTRLDPAPGHLVLTLRGRDPAFPPGVFERRLERLAAALGLRADIVRE
ncbi:MAG: Ppx/GppA family phosphatase [Alphaproteobacteria bacterium]|nr:Ppx/GppA family phosphatase [Alphaproteobacteria bacterium]